MADPFLSDGSEPGPRPPSFLRKRDGRVVPFEADRISQSLFAASEEAGHPNAFLARELADGIVYFLAQEREAETLTTEELEEVISKVVRELGHPALALAFTEVVRRPAPREAGLGGERLSLPFRPGCPASQVRAACLRTFALQGVFTRDLAAAGEAGLLVLSGLESPDELAACVLGPAQGFPSLARRANGRDEDPSLARRANGLPDGLAPAGLLAALAEAPAQARLLAVDGLEYWLAEVGQDPVREVRDFGLGLRLAGARAVLNLNQASPPPWASEAEGPLFEGQRRSPGEEKLTSLANAILEGAETRREWRLDWHLGERDFAPEGRERLVRVARLALERENLGFVFDRPRRPMALAEGLDRQYPALVQTVGLRLANLVEGAGEEKFLEGLGTLARLALSAAAQKREYLRRSEQGLSRGFLLDRARLMVVPLGLEEVVLRFTGKRLSAGGTGLELARKVVARLRAALQRDQRTAPLAACVDWPFDLSLEGEPAGLLDPDAAAGVKAQLRVGNQLHGAAERGTLAVVLPGDSRPTSEQVADWLAQAWQGEVCRVRFLQLESNRTG